MDSMIKNNKPYSVECVDKGSKGVKRCGAHGFKNGLREQDGILICNSPDTRDSVFLTDDLLEDLGYTRRIKCGIK